MNRKIIFCICILSIQLCYSQKVSLELLESISLPILGVDRKLLEIEDAGFILKESHPKEASSMADIMFESSDKKMFLVYYINDGCIQSDWCNTVDLYIGESKAKDIERAVIQSGSYSKLSSSVTDTGVTTSYINGNKNEFPYSIISFSKYVSKGVNRYIVSFSRNANAVKDWSFRRKYKSIE